VRVSVDADRCQGHTACAMAAPDVFGLSDDDGHSIVLLPEVPTHLEDAVRKASLNCPERAVLLSD
jgi:ferredoxin